MTDMTVKLGIASIAYSGGIAVIMADEAVTDYALSLPTLQLIAIVSIICGVSGLASYYYDVRREKRANLKASLAFSGFVGMVVALFTFDYFVAQRGMVSLWFGIVGGASFAHIWVLAFIERAFAPGGLLETYIIARKQIHDTESGKKKLDE